ncbi:PqqD family peptide modification chaperone [bacterium]|nr:PqqD family peptide modification chaperone [bacterium]
MENFVINLLSQRVPQRLPAQVRRDGDFVLALSEKLPRVAVLNRVAVEIYNLCNGKRTIKDIIDKLCTQYPNIKRKRITIDVIKCLQELEYKALVKGK